MDRKSVTIANGISYFWLCVPKKITPEVVLLSGYTTLGVTQDFWIEPVLHFSE